jgi:hypothetical protein
MRVHNDMNVPTSRLLEPFDAEPAFITRGIFPTQILLYIGKLAGLITHRASIDAGLEVSIRIPYRDSSGMQFAVLNCIHLVGIALPTHGVFHGSENGAFCTRM